MLFKNRESIRLYRDILRSARLFVWKNKDGILWSEILKDNARKEFEQSRNETDPEMIRRLQVIGRQCLDEAVEKVLEKSKQITDDIDRTRTS
jgi:hypothetical protein